MCAKEILNDCEQLMMRSQIQNSFSHANINCLQVPPLVASRSRCSGSVSFLLRFAGVTVNTQQCIQAAILSIQTNSLLEVSGMTLNVFFKN